MNEKEGREGREGREGKERKKGIKERKEGCQGKLQNKDLVDLFSVHPVDRITLDTSMRNNFHVWFQ